MNPETIFLAYATPWCVAPDKEGKNCIMDRDGVVIFYLAENFSFEAAQLTCKVMNAYCKVTRWLKEDRYD